MHTHKHSQTSKQTLHRKTKQPPHRPISFSVEPRDPQVQLSPPPPPPPPPPLRGVRVCCPIAPRGTRNLAAISFGGNRHGTTLERGKVTYVGGPSFYPNQPAPYSPTSCSSSFLFFVLPLPNQHPIHPLFLVFFSSPLLLFYFFFLLFPNRTITQFTPPLLLFLFFLLSPITRALPASLYLLRPFSIQL